jgi:hypothetical protein
MRHVKSQIGFWGHGSRDGVPTKEAWDHEFKLKYNQKKNNERPKNILKEPQESL